MTTNNDQSPFKHIRKYYVFELSLTFTLDFVNCKIQDGIQKYFYKPRTKVHFSFYHFR